MLTQKQKEVPYVAILKLVTGEEIITKVVEESTDSFTVKNPLCMVPTKEGWQFAPLLMMADIDKTINIPKPVISATPDTKLITQYESITTGIALPQKSSIIT